MKGKIKMLTKRQKNTADRRLKKAYQECAHISRFYDEMREAYDLWSSDDKEKQAKAKHIASVLAFSLFGQIYCVKF